MLADCCPDCGVPLMRHPTSHELLCVNCGDDSPAQDTVAPAGAAAAEEQGHADAVLERLPNGTAGSHSSSEDEGDDGGLVAAPPSLSTRLRQAMDLPTGDGSEARSSTSAGGAALQASPATNAIGGQARAAAGGSGSSGQAQAQVQHDASKEIAELMLEGWAMLQDHCPRCLNPLLRSRDRRIYCAGCQMYAVREGDMTRQQQQQHLEAAGAQHAAAEREPVAASRPAAAVPAPPPPAAAFVPASAPLPMPATRPTAPLPFTAMHQHVPAVDAAAAAVAQRLAAATAALQAQGPAGDAAKLLYELQQCATTIQALADCRRSLMGTN